MRDIIMTVSNEGYKLFHELLAKEVDKFLNQNNMKVDIEGNVLVGGDIVYYAKKRKRVKNGQLVKCEVININKNTVSLRSIDGAILLSTSPEDQLLKVN